MYHLTSSMKPLAIYPTETHISGLSDHPAGILGATHNILVDGMYVVFEVFSVGKVEVDESIDVTRQTPIMMRVGILRRLVSFMNDGR